MEAWLRFGSAASRLRVEKVNFVEGNAVVHVWRVVADVCMWAAVSAVEAVYLVSISSSELQNRRVHTFGREGCNVGSITS